MQRKYTSLYSSSSQVTIYLINKVDTEASLEVQNNEEKDAYKIQSNQPFNLFNENHVFKALNLNQASNEDV